ncbi:MAG TPA: hypothetical protein DFJ59_09385 [Alphaproteobacteria bacterium]|nr:hypothetical protein [Alphaproteobacteria bacterium]
MNWLCTLAAVALTGLTVTPASAQSGDFLAALSATRASDPEAASRYLTAALERDPDQQSLVRQQISVYTIEGDYDAALPYAQDVLALNPDDELARWVVRVAAIRRGDWDAAQAVLPAVIQTRLDEFIATVANAAVLTGAGDIEAALDETRTGFDEKGIGPLGDYARGLIYAASGEAEAASDALAAFISRDPFQYPRMAEVTANAFERSGDLENARFVYNALLETGARPGGQAGIDRIEQGDPYPEALTPTPLDIYTELLFVIVRLLDDQDSPELAYRYAQEIGYLLTPEAPLFPGFSEVIASSLLALERFEEAEAAYATLEDVPAFRFSAILGQIQALSDQERYDEALAKLDEAEAILGRSPAILRQRAVLLFRAEDYEAADLAFAEWQDSVVQPGAAAAQTLFIAGIVSYQLEDYTQMEERLESSLELDPDNPHVMNYLAYSWVERGINLDRGFDMLMRAVELAPESGAIIDSLGWAHYQLGDYDEAVPFLEQAFQINPWSWEIAEHVADAYWQVGRELEAGFFWNRALGLPEIPDDHVEAIRIKLVEGMSRDPAQ